MSTFGSVLVHNEYTVEEYEDPDGKKRKRTIAPAESCSYCGDDLMLCLKAEFRQAGSTFTRAVPCKFCVRGMALSERLARGGRGRRRIRTDMAYSLDDVVVAVPPGEDESDVDCARRWLAAGWERKADGFLYSIHDGARAPLQPPETALPPLPDGTRPAGAGQGPRLAPGLVRSVDEPDRRSDAPNRRHGPRYPARLIPTDDGAHVYVEGAIGPIFDAPLRFSELGSASPSRAELEQASRVSGVPMGKLLAALRKMAGEKPPKPRVVRADPARPDRSSGKGGGG
jgi:hypothetical protein